ncbi:MAG: hypothetical protein V1914_04585 [archaeon]
MPIIGFAFDKILVENKITEKGENAQKVETHIVVSDIKEEKAGINTKDALLRLDFLFELVYDPKVADMLLGGHVDYVGPEKEVKKMLADWKKDKRNLDFESVRTILNLVLIKCNIKALELSQQVNLPPHLAMPLMGKQEAKKGAEQYIG